MTAYLNCSSEKLKDADLGRLIDVLPENRRSMIGAKSGAGKRQSLFATLLGYYLLLESNSAESFISPREVSVSEILKSVNEIAKIAAGVGWVVGESGKPFESGLFVGGEKRYLSFSHSGDIVCVSAGSRETGVDVERLRPNSDIKRLFKISERFFSKNERDRLSEAENPELEFYKLWTAKEAVIKLDGGGIKLLRSFSIAEDCSFNLGGKSGNIETAVVPIHNSLNKLENIVIISEARLTE